MAESAEKTLLLVEDEATVAIAEKRTLERFGYSVVTVSSGERAVEAIETTADIDLVLMDIDLGSGMDGTEAAKRILSRHELPIVFLSSHTEPEFVERTEGITSYGYIVKNSPDTVLDASIKMAFKLFEAHRDVAEQSRRVKSRNEELRVMNEKLAWWHELMEYVVQHDPSAVAVLDNALRFVYVSDRFLADYRIADREVAGKHHHEVFPHTSKNWRAVHTRALNGEVVSSDTDYFEHSDGTIDYIRWECRPWYDAEGAIGGIVVYTEVLTEKIQAQEALKDRQALLEQAEQIAHIGNWELDLRRNELTWSDEVYRLFGLEPQEFPATYEAFLERVHPEDRQAVDEAYSRSLREGEYQYQIEHRIVRAHSGDVRYVFETCTHERGSDGTLIRSIGMVQDVTEHKRLEGKLTQQELRARWLSEIARRVLSGWSVQQIIDYTVNEVSKDFPAVRVAYSTVDSQGVLRTLSSVEPENMPNIEGLEADLNQAPDYLRALRGEEPVLVSDVEEDPRLEAIRHALAAGNTRAMLDVPLTHSKELVGLLCFDAPSPRRWAEHEIALLQEIADYLTLAIQNERSKTALQQSEARFRKIVTYAQIGIVTVSAQETILEANPFFCDWLGYSEQELKQLTIGDITHAEDHEREKVLMGQLQRGELDAARMEKRYIRKNGEIVWGDMVTNVIEGQEETKRFGLGLVVDITARKKRRRTYSTAPAGKRHRSQRSAPSHKE